MLLCSFSSFHTLMMMMMIMTFGRCRPSWHTPTVKKPFNKSERVSERARRPKSNRLSQTDRKELRLDEDYDVGGGGGPEVVK